MKKRKYYKMEQLSPEYVDITIDRAEAMELEETFYHDDIHLAAWQTKQRALFAKPLEVKMGEPNQDVQQPDVSVLHEFANGYYVPIAKEFLPDRYILGYTVFVNEEHEDPRFEGKILTIPFRVPRKYYDLVCRLYFTGKKKYFVRPCFTGFNWKQDDEGDPRFHVYIVDGYAPHLPSGKHNSIVAYTRKRSEYMNQLYECFVKAQIQRSHPPVVLEEQPDNTQKSTDVAFPGDDFLNMQANKGIIKSRLAVNESLIVDSLSKRLRGADDEYSTSTNGPLEDRKRFKCTYEDNRFYVPTNYKMAAQPQMPEAQDDITEFAASREKNILALHGVPASCVMAEPKGNSGSDKVDDGDFTQFTRTLSDESGDICRFIRSVYLSSLPALKGKADLIFQQRLIPFATPSAIQRLHDFGIIHNKARVAALLALNGMQPDDEATEEEETTRPPLNGNENQIPKIIRAKDRVMNAEADEREANAKAKLAEIDLKRSETEGQLKLIDKQMEFEKFKLEAEKELLILKTEADKQKILLQKETQKQQAKKKKKASE